MTETELHIDRDERVGLAELGLRLDEAKQLTAALQAEIVPAQVAVLGERGRSCTACGRVLASKGHYGARFRSLFGDVPVRVRRLHVSPSEPMACASAKVCSARCRASRPPASSLCPSPAVRLVVTRPTGTSPSQAKRTRRWDLARGEGAMPAGRPWPTRPLCPACQAHPFLHRCVVGFVIVTPE